MTIAVMTLTRPTRGRLALWLVLAVVWFLFLPQDLAMDPHHRHLSWPGVVLWVVVLGWLLSCALITQRRLRGARSAMHAQGRDRQKR
jgi:hypothetical protein